MSADLISSELNGCEATRFAVAATSQSRDIGWSTCLRHVIRVDTGFTVCSYVQGIAAFCVQIGRSHGELGRFIATHFK